MEHITEQIQVKKSVVAAKGSPATGTRKAELIVCNISFPLNDDTTKKFFKFFYNEMIVRGLLK